MVHRLLRPLLVALVAIALVGAPTFQAAVSPTSAMHAAAAQHETCSEQLANPAPCKSMVPACADMLGCVTVASLPVPAISAAVSLTWTSIAYRVGSDVQDGLSIKPDLGPPIPFV